MSLKRGVLQNVGWGGGVDNDTAESRSLDKGYNRKYKVGNVDIFCSASQENKPEVESILFKFNKAPKEEILVLYSIFSEEFKLKFVNGTLNYNYLYASNLLFIRR